DFPLIEDMVESLRPFAPDAAAFDAFVAQWIYGTALPELELGETVVEGAGDMHAVGVTLRNIGTGQATVTVRLIGEKPESGEAPFVDTAVELVGPDPVVSRISAGFRPVRVLVDPEVKLLFAGRKRCDRSL
ncbi:MAG: hypothetical protein ACO3QC_15265, partial [Phycisphaerales bacterium]